MASGTIEPLQKILQNRQNPFVIYCVLCNEGFPILWIPHEHRARIHRHCEHCGFWICNNHWERKEPMCQRCFEEKSQVKSHFWEHICFECGFQNFENQQKLLTCEDCGWTFCSNHLKMVFVNIDHEWGYDHLEKRKEHLFCTHCENLYHRMNLRSCLCDNDSLCRS